MIALDDDSASRQLSAVLRKGGHDVSTPTDLTRSLQACWRPDAIITTGKTPDLGHTLFPGPVESAHGGGTGVG